MSLLNKKCIPCEGNTQPLNEGEIKNYLKELKNNWEVLDNKKIKCEFIFNNFKEAVNFVDKIAEVAENERHHPDIHIFYNKVLIEIWTHAIKGLSENDFILAAKIEQK